MPLKVTGPVSSSGLGVILYPNAVWALPRELGTYSGVMFAYNEPGKAQA